MKKITLIRALAKETGCVLICVTARLPEGREKRHGAAARPPQR